MEIDLITIGCILSGLLGLLAVGLAYYFGRRYIAGGNKSHKYICVSYCVAGCVCIITAIQIFFMFHTL